MRGGVWQPLHDIVARQPKCASRDHGVWRCCQEGWGIRRWWCGVCVRGMPGLSFLLFYFGFWGCGGVPISAFGFLCDGSHTPPIAIWHSGDSLCYGVGARVAYITAKCKMQIALFLYLTQLSIYHILLGSNISDKVYTFEVRIPRWR